MPLAEIVNRAYDLARNGPEPLARLLVKVEVVYGEEHDVTFDDVVAAVSTEGEGGPVRAVLRTYLARWDDVEDADWTEGTDRGTVERRILIYDRMELDSPARLLLSDRVPFHRRSRPIVIKADRWEPWYGQDRKIGRTFYWDAFSGQLRTKAGWNEDSILGLDESTDAVVARLADPLSAAAYQSKGLVVGYVQSGKTANITGVVAKAADAGYRLVIVLAGTLNVLRDQTQRRLDRELVGVELLEDEYDDDAELGAFLSHGARPSQLGAFDWTRLTGRGREYRKLSGGAIESLKFVRRVPNHPMNHPDNLYPLPAKLLVVKKQATVLDRLARDLARINTQGELAEVPALVVDDESDQASVNTMRPPPRHDTDEDEERRERNRINAAIVGLLNVLPRGQYIGYTATPFANVFVDPADAEGTFPRDFIVSLPRPVGYLGASDFHDLDGPPPGVEEEPFCSNERAFVRPVYGDDADARNLQLAIDSYLIAGAVKLYRAHHDPTFVPRHHTLMVHTSQKIADHREQFEAVRRHLRNGGYQTGTAGRRIRVLFESDFAPVSAARAPQLPFPSSFEEVEDLLGEVLTRLNRGGHPVLLVNSTAEADQLAFDSEGVWKIIVGGAKLSRGFTVEGLTTSYFRRRSPTADTLMQMGRWCGFRHGYADLVRLFIGRREPQGREVVDVYEAFEGICRDEEAFRLELERYALPDNGEPPITPMDIPPLVATHLEWIRPTSRNKMFNAEITFRNLGGKAIEHRRVAQSAEQKRHNEAAVRGLLTSATFDRHVLTNAGVTVEALGGVRAREAVRALLGAYAFADRSNDFAPELEFIDGKVGDPCIDDWAVLLPQLKQATEQTWPIATFQASVHRRAYWAKPLVNAFMGPTDKLIAESIVGLRDLQRPSSDLLALRSDRRACLLVYPMRHEIDERGWVPTMGLTLVFPNNQIPRRISFAVRSPKERDQPIIDVV